MSFHVREWTFKPLFNWVKNGVFAIFHPVEKELNPYHTGVWRRVIEPGGGHYGPPYHESVCCCRMVRAMLTKLPDFVPFHICQVPESQFWCLFFKKLKKIDVENFWGSSSIRRKSENFEIFHFFTNKP